MEKVHCVLGNTDPEQLIQRILFPAMAEQVAWASSLKTPGKAGEIYLFEGIREQAMHEELWG